jgi:MerR family regulatory protein
VDRQFAVRLRMAQKCLSWAERDGRDGFMEELTISEVAKRADIHASAIRYYESVQLLTPPQRSAGRRSWLIARKLHLGHIQLETWACKRASPTDGPIERAVRTGALKGRKAEAAVPPRGAPTPQRDHSPPL